MSESSLPLVTVFTPIFNTGRFVVQTLESVRDNHYPNIQHIIIDDGSTDDSVALVKKWIEENQYPCVFVEHPQNLGLCKTMNEMLSLAKGKYLVGISDDLLTPDRIQSHVSIFENGSPELGVVYGDVQIIDSDNNLLVPSYFKYQEGNGVKPVDGWVYHDLLLNNFIPAPGATIKMAVYEKVGRYDEDLFFEDWDMWLRISRHFNFMKSDAISAYYRRHENSMSFQPDARIYECCLQTIHRNVFDRKSRILAASAMFTCAKGYYVVGGKRPWKYFWQSLTFDFRFPTLGFLAVSLLFKASFLMSVRKAFSSSRDGQ